MQNGVMSFRQIKIHHNLLNIIWRQFVKLNSRQTFWPQYYDDGECNQW